MATTRKSKATPRQLAALKKARAAKVKQATKNKKSLNGKVSNESLVSALWQLHFVDYETIGKYCVEKLPAATMNKIYKILMADLDINEQVEVMRLARK